MITKILMSLCGLILPVLLFFSRYVLTAMFEKIFTNNKKEKDQIKVELIHFPNELLMISIGYTMPAIIEYIRIAISETEFNLNTIIALAANIMFTFLLLIILPFWVAETKIIEKEFFKKNIEKVKKHCTIIYALSIIAVVVSILLGVLFKQ